MDQNKKRYISYLCPKCRQSVIVARDLFTLAAAPNRIKCPCGKSELHLEFMPNRVRLSVPCAYCGRDHQVSCPSQAFVRDQTLAFSCAESGLDCCYVGEEGAVYAATARLEQAMDKVDEEAEDKGTFLDELVMHEVLSEIKEIAQRGGISCACGSSHWDFDVHYSSVDLICTDCGAQMRIPAATADDIDDICCKTTLLIRGQRH